MSKYWRWKERAEAYDAYLRRRDLEIWEEERTADKRARIGMIKQFGEKVLEAIDIVDVERIPMSQLVDVLHKYLDELRTEYNDFPNRQTPRWTTLVTPEGHLQKVLVDPSGKVVPMLEDGTPDWQGVSGGTGTPSTVVNVGVLNDARQHLVERLDAIATRRGQEVGNPEPQE